MTSKIALNKGPAYHLLKPNKVQADLPTQSVSQTRSINEDARSVTPERHHSRSQRSGSRANSQQEDQQSQRSGRDRSVRSTDSVSVQYRKVSSSLVSNPDNLICDDCINKKIGQGHKDRAQEQRDLDKEHANKTNANLKKQLQVEKEKHLEKLKKYKDGIDGQNVDLLEKRAKMRDDEEKEKERIKRQMADNSDLIALDKKRKDVLNKYRDELAWCLDRDDEAKAQKERERIALEKKTHNLLIDDGWRAPHQQVVKNHYKENLINQMNDKANEKHDAKKADEDADKEYMDNVVAFNRKDKEQKARIEGEKKGLLREELDKQLEENAGKRKDADDLKRDLDEKHKKKIQDEQAVFLDNLNRKKQWERDHLNDLVDQLHEKEEEKLNAKIESKKAQGTGLHIPHKLKKCYNCSHCRRVMALERLNKRYEVARSKSKAKRLQQTQ